MTPALFFHLAQPGQGGEEFLGIYRFLDAVPRGRQEYGPSFSLPDWVRLHKTYGKGGTVEVHGRFTQPNASAPSTHSPADTSRQPL